MKFNKEKLREFIHRNLTLIIAVFIMLVLLVFVYIPKISTLSGVKHQFEKKAQELTGNNELIDRLVDIGAEYQAVKVELDRRYREHAGHRQIPQMLVSLTAADADLNLDIQAINRSPQEKGRFFVKVPLELHITASYRSFAEYVDRITRISQLLDIRRIEIEQDHEIYPRLRVKLLVDAYFLEGKGGT